MRRNPNHQELADWVEQELPASYWRDLSNMDKYDAVSLLAERTGFRKIDRNESISDTSRGFLVFLKAKNESGFDWGK